MFCEVYCVMKIPVFCLALPSFHCIVLFTVFITEHKKGCLLLRLVWFDRCTVPGSCAWKHDVDQGSATFWTSGPHSILIRFQRAATIPANRKRKVVKNSCLFSDESMAKTKKGFRHRMRIVSAVYCCMSIIEKKKVVGRMTIKGRGPVRCLGGPHPARGPCCQPNVDHDYQFYFSRSWGTPGVVGRKVQF